MDAKSSGRTASTLKAGKHLPNETNEQRDHPDISTIGLILLAAFLLGLKLLMRGPNKRPKNNSYVLRRTELGHEQYEHRQIAEEVLGRRLGPGEVVHHINGRRNDNRPANLCIMARIDHDRYHEWYEWVYKTYGNYPRRETQIRKLRESFNGILLADFVNLGAGSG